MSKSNEKIKDIWGQIKVTAGAKQVLNMPTINKIEKREVEKSPQEEDKIEEILGQGLLNG